MNTRAISAGLVLAIAAACGAAEPAKINPVAMPDSERAKQVRDMRFGMFICWSFSTFSGREWTRGVKEVAFFKATACDTDQWCRTAKEAGMSYILFLTKHHDGFCLWDTRTTDWKVTKAPLGIDVLAKLRKSCDKYGIKLALYFSEGDWTWKGNKNPERKKAQLKELCTEYGPIEFYWMDHAQSTGGLDHKATVEWVRKFQPNCFVGFNHGKPAGRLCIRERGRPGPIGNAAATKYNKDAERKHKGYLVAEFTYPILPAHKGGAQWFYSLPKHDQLCHPAEKIYLDYLGSVKHGNIFSLDVGPDYAGRIRDIDVKTLRKVGQYIRGELKAPVPPPAPKPVAGKPSASGTWQNRDTYGPSKAFDGDPTTRWGAPEKSRSGWLAIELTKPRTIRGVRIDEGPWGRARKFELQHRLDDGTWKTLATGTTLGPRRAVTFAPVTVRHVRLNVTQAVEVPTIVDVSLLDAK